jgi:hypothetical protein
MFHQQAADAPPALSGRDGQVVDPAAAPLVAGHDCADDATGVGGYEEQFRLHTELPRDVARLVGRTTGSGEAAFTGYPLFRGDGPQPLADTVWRSARWLS